MKLESRRGRDALYCGVRALQSARVCQYIIGRSRSRAAAEKEIARLLTRGSDVTVDRFSGLLRLLEPDRLAGLLLAHGRTIDGVTMRRNVLHLQADNVTASELDEWKSPSSNIVSRVIRRFDGHRARPAEILLPGKGKRLTIAPLCRASGECRLRPVLRASRL